MPVRRGFKRRTWLLGAVRSDYLRFFGITLFLISILFIAHFAYSNWTDLASVRIQKPAWLGLAAALYGICVFLSALSWPILLRGLGSPLAIWPLLRIGLVSQVGKYIPGNFAHYVGRIAMAKAEGVSVRQTGVSSGLEILLACLSAFMVSATALATEPQLWSPIEDYGGAIPLGILAVGSVSIFTVFWMRRHSVRISSVLVPLMLISSALVLAGASLQMAVEAIGGNVTLNLAIGIYAVAWFIGFITPGAPAGMGLREAVIVATISMVAGMGTAIAAAILHRVLTATVDGTLAITAWALRK